MSEKDKIKSQKREEALIKKQLKLNKKLDKIDEKLNEEIEKREYIQSNERKIFSHKMHRARVHVKNAPPVRSTIEEVGNATTHGLGAAFGVAALVLMLLKSTNFRMNFSSMIYGISIIFMMLMSCIYHALPAKTMGKHVLRRFDYTSIYILIGGTFTPMFLLFFYQFHPVISIVLCSVQWAIIIAGIVNVCVFGPGRHKPINFSLYILLGWCGIVFIPILINHNIKLFWYILGGGIVYTVGIIPFFLKRKSAHFIWHFFVLGGAILQFVGIYLTLF